MPKIQQLSIFLENKPGRLAEVTDTLTGGGMNIHALSLADTSDFGILRLIVSDSTKAKELLKKNGFTVSLTTVIALEMSHSPGGLNKVLQIFKDNSVNIEYMYAFVHNHTVATLVFRTDNEDKAIKILGENKIRLLTEAEILKM